MILFPDSVETVCFMWVFHACVWGWLVEIVSTLEGV